MDERGRGGKGGRGGRGGRGGAGTPGALQRGGQALAAEGVGARKDDWLARSAAVVAARGTPLAEAAGGGRRSGRHLTGHTKRGKRRGRVGKPWETSKWRNAFAWQL